MFSYYTKREYWIIFYHVKHKWSWLFKKNFTHVKLMSCDKFNWIELNPTTKHLKWEVIPYHPSEPAWKIYTQRGAKCIKILMGEPIKTQQIVALKLTSCVQCVLYILGLKLFCLTPYRLFRKLASMTEQQKTMHGIWSIQIMI